MCVMFVYMSIVIFFFFKQKTAYEMLRSLVGSEMCIRDRAHTLQEILTIKSDDVAGRSKAYESIIKGEPIKKLNIPESFNVLVRELKGLALDVQPLDAEGNIVELVNPMDDFTNRYDQNNNLEANSNVNEVIREEVERRKDKLATAEDSENLNII